jgi:hypothetical protein
MAIEVTPIEHLSVDNAVTDPPESAITHRVEAHLSWLTQWRLHQEAVQDQAYASNRDKQAKWLEHTLQEADAFMPFNSGHKARVSTPAGHDHVPGRTNSRPTVMFFIYALNRAQNSAIEQAIPGYR